MGHLTFMDSHELFMEYFMDFQRHNQTITSLNFHEQFKNILSMNVHELKMGHLTFMGLK